MYFIFCKNEIQFKKQKVNRFFEILLNHFKIYLLNNNLVNSNVQNTAVIVAEDREIAEAKTLRAEVFDGLTLEELTDKEEEEE